MFKFNLDDEKILKNPLQFEYVNWKGNKGVRTVIPIEVYYGQNDFHKGNQWLLKAYDVDKKSERHFAIKDIIRFLDNKEDYFKRDGTNLKKYEIWSEGYKCTGNSSGAILMGKETGGNFQRSLCKILFKRWRR